MRFKISVFNNAISTNNFVKTSSFNDKTKYLISACLLSFTFINVTTILPHFNTNITILL